MPYSDPLKAKAYRSLRNKQWCKEYRIRRRHDVLTHYSNGKLACACCSEERIEFLSIDHIDGGGTQQKKALGTRDMYALIIRLGFPDGYRVLCHNCNQAYGFYGNCPHNHREIDREA